jgi:hypothetical protein
MLDPGLPYDRITDEREGGSQVDKGTKVRLVQRVRDALEAVESGIVTWEQEFGMFVVLPDGRTAYATGRVRPLLAPGEGS